MTNEELVEQIQAGINVTDNLGILYEQNKPFLYLTIKPFMKWAETDDLLQEAYLGLHDAAYAYKPGETKFLTYLPWRIRQKCIKYIEDNSNTKRIPIYKQIEINKYLNFISDYKNKHGENPTDSLIIKGLGINEKKLNSIKKALYEKNCVSLSSTLPDAEDFTLEDMIADSLNLEESVQEKILIEYERKVIDKAIGELKKSEQIVIRLRYLEEETQKQIAEKMNLSDSRIGQLEKSALKKLKKMDRIIELHDDIYGYDSSCAYRMSVKKCVDYNTSPTEILAMRRIELEEKQKKLTKSIDNIFLKLLEGKACINERKTSIE